MDRFVVGARSVYLRLETNLKDGLSPQMQGF
jgi:hypothetical protein